MKRLVPLLLLLLVFSSCKKGSGDDSDCQVTGETSCSIDLPVEGGSDGDSSGGTTTGGTNTGGSTSGGSTTGGSTTGGSNTTGGSTGGVVDPSDPPPTQAYTFDVNILFINTTTTQRAKFEKAIDLIKRLVASDEFKNMVLNHTYNGVKTYVDNRGYTNAQIYQKILDGAETLKPIKNNTMDMEVELYYADNTTVGYTYANSTRVWVNRKYFDTNSVSSVAANLVHEWLHKLGFGHSVSYNAARDYSVPYAIGRMVRTLGPKI